MTRLIHAFLNSLAGLKSAYQTEAAFRQETWLFIVLFPLALWLNVTLTLKLWLISSLFLVLIAELINTAIEATIDRISEKRHPLSKKAKDIGSSLVLVALIHAIIIWLTILTHIL